MEDSHPTSPSREVLWWRENEQVVRAHLPDILPRRHQWIAAATVEPIGHADVTASASASGTVHGGRDGDSGVHATPPMGPGTVAAGAAAVVSSSSSSSTEHSRGGRAGRLPRLSGGGPSPPTPPAHLQPQYQTPHRSPVSDATTTPGVSAVVGLVLPVDVLGYSPDQWASSLDAANCPPDIKSSLIDAYTVATSSRSASDIWSKPRAPAVQLHSTAPSSNGSGDAARWKTGGEAQRRAPHVSYTVNTIVRCRPYQLPAITNAPAAAAGAATEPRCPPTPPPRASRPPLLSATAAAQRRTAADECFGREAIELEEALAALAFRPPHALAEAPVAADAEDEDDARAPTPHPFLARAVARIEVEEEFGRRAIADDEAAEFSRSLESPYRAFLSVAQAGSLHAAEKQLRHWIARHRGRKILFAEQRADLVARECAARLDLIRSDPSYRARDELFLASLHFQERWLRASMQLVCAKASYAAGLAAVRLEEQCARFPIEFGQVMSRTRLCGRTEDCTLFRCLCIREEVERQAIMEEEQAGHGQAPFVLALEELVTRDEPQARWELEEEAETDCWEHRCTVCVLLAVHAMRDVSRYEVVGRVLDLEKVHEELMAKVAEEERKRQQEEEERRAKEEEERRIKEEEERLAKEEEERLAKEEEERLAKEEEERRAKEEEEENMKPDEEDAIKQDDEEDTVKHDEEDVMKQDEEDVMKQDEEAEAQQGHNASTAEEDEIVPNTTS